MWLAPAVLFVSAADPLRVATGALLVAFSAHLVISRAIEFRSGKTRRRRRVRESGRFLFRFPDPREHFVRRTIPTIVAAVLFNAGILAILIYRGFAGSALIAVAVTIWTWRAARAGTPRIVPFNPTPGRTLLSSVLTLLFAFGLSMAQVAGTSPSDAPSPAVRPENKPSGSQARRLKLIIPAKDLVPGVILRPENPGKQSAQFSSVMRSFHTGGVPVSKPLEFPFTVEYHLFPTASRHVQGDSAVYSGTPLDAVYINVSGGTLETHAVQELRPAVDFTRCRSVQVKLINGERSLGAASVELSSPTRRHELKAEIFGFEAGPEDFLSFDVPADVAGPVNTIRLKFRLVDPSRRAHTAKVAVKAFRLLPR